MFSLTTNLGRKSREKSTAFRAPMAVSDSVSGTTSYTTNSLNQYTTVAAQVPIYDANGNLTNLNGWTYSYDAQNRLLTASSGTNSESFAYDAQNRCVSRTLNGVSTYYLYDGWQLAEELNASGVEQALYVAGANTDELLYKATPAGTVFYQHDALGSTTALTDANGNLIERYTYDVFGKPAIFDASGNPLTASAYNNRFLYTGREWLQEVGLYDYRNRVYSADLGRFLQTDPMRFSAGDVNVYRYVGNDPINEFDSNGLKAHIDVYRTSRISQTYVVVHENGNYIGSCNGNMSGFVRGKQGTSDGTYTVTPKKNYEPGDSFVEGTPTITGYERIHPEGYSSGCLTVPEEWANEIWDIMKRNQCHGGTTITFQTSQIPHAQAVNQNPRPGSIHHSWPIFNVQGVESVPQWPNGKGPGTSNYQGY